MQMYASYLISFAHFRPCVSCDKKFATSKGLDSHLAIMKDCGKVAKKIHKAKKIKELALRNKNIHGLSLKRIGPHKKLATPRKRGAPLSRQEKELVLHHYDSFRSKNCTVWKLLLST